ncbi:MAG: hypothetical protein HYR58_07925 [Acidobacteria bacterium]|nr:hypothetical protein [Acidobacteriota bacterium]
MPGFLLFVLLSFSVFGGELQTPSAAPACGDCHRAIYDGWKNSAHATSMESWLFQDALKLAEAEFGSQARKVCLDCHSPIAVYVDDLGLVRKVSWEGVTCDYCHSIREVSTTAMNPRARVEFTQVKSGPSRNAASPVHGTVFSPVHTTSLACISCHEFRNAQGLSVLTTYTEWKNSRYAKEEQSCQTCHMYTIRGNVVDPRVKRTESKEINLHQMPGSHSIDQLNRAIKASLYTEREGDRLKITVKVKNAGAGHHVPTGSPLRQLILEVRAEPYGGVQYSEERIYSRIVADQNGTPIQHEHFAFLKGAKVLSDTRLAADEVRAETFSFKVPRARQVRVEANFYYYYSPVAGTGARGKTKFLSFSRLVP